MVDILPSPTRTSRNFCGSDSARSLSAVGGLNYFLKLVGVRKLAESDEL